MTSETSFDVCIVGGGIIGLSVGRALGEAFPGISIAVVDKEDRVAAHQSSHNSGVVHSGLYYRPGSLKARLCTSGREQMYRFCEESGIAYRRCGKLVIAVDDSELGALDELERRGNANGLEGLRRIGPDEIREIEPEAVGVSALHVPEAGVADFPAVAAELARRLVAADAALMTGFEVSSIDHGANRVRLVSSDDREVRARVLVNCAGLHSDRVAAMAGVEPSVRIVPFRGEYYRLTDEAEHLVRHLIYPVPDPRFPFLGVHFTRRVDGSVEVGPNAVLALGREHYRESSPDWSELFRILTYPGFLRLASRHWWSGARELLSSRSTRLYARLARRLVPSVRSADLAVGGAGVRAQAVARDGSLVDDFVIQKVGSMVHVLNAPSPAATASLAIGRHVADQTEALITG